MWASVHATFAVGGCVSEIWLRRWAYDRAPPTVSGARRRRVCGLTAVSPVCLVRLMRLGSLDGRRAEALVFGRGGAAWRLR